jgi:hypothetical protein
MPAISLQQAQEQLDAYLAAEKAVLGSSQHYEINGRKLTRANLAEIQAGITIWTARVELAQRTANGRSRRRTIIARG